MQLQQPGIEQRFRRRKVSKHSLGLARRGRLGMVPARFARDLVVAPLSAQPLRPGCVSAGHGCRRQPAAGGARRVDGDERFSDLQTGSGIRARLEGNRHHSPRARGQGMVQQDRVPRGLGPRGAISAVRRLDRIGSEGGFGLSARAVGPQPKRFQHHHQLHRRRAHVARRPHLQQPRDHGAQRPVDRPRRRVFLRTAQGETARSSAGRRLGPGALGVRGLFRSGLGAHDFLAPGRLFSRARSRRRASARAFRGAMQLPRAGRGAVARPGAAPGAKRETLRHRLGRRRRTVCRALRLSGGRRLERLFVCETRGENFSANEIGFARAGRIVELRQPAAFDGA
ncbi:MAG: hypothetical protein BWZ10_00354 [candidate division BRC1 bacterium ADurb.BinA364]|nr:MAG: hypothetical protein BWZ10_00354 [candidate division BRC1 bacterium ADurb.BinA364]